MQRNRSISVSTCVSLTLVAACVTLSPAQTQPMYEREPFDQLILTEAAGGQVVDVYPLKIKRQPDVQRGPTDLRVRLLAHPDREYDIAWKDIQQVRFFEQIILDGAEQLIRAKELDEAYWHLEALRRLDTAWPGLETATLRFLKEDVASSFRAGQLLQALATLAEIQRVAPTDRLAARGMARVVQRLFDERFNQGDFPGAQDTVDWAARPNNPLQLDAWVASARQQLEEQADGLVAQAEEKFGQGDYRAARALIGTAQEAAPGHPGAQALSRRINSRHPRVVVGVTRAADPNRLGARHDWASRRLTRLVRRELVELLDYGADGGRYVCPYGELKVDSSNRGVLIQLRPSSPGQPDPITGYDIARTLLSPHYPVDVNSALTSSLFASVQVDEVYQVKVDFTSPVLQPRGLFALPLSPDVEPPAAYRRVNNTRARLEFEQARPSVDSEAESFELAEHLFGSVSEMITALRSGNVTVIDRLTPLQARRIDRQAGLTTRRYRFPSQHFLIPNPDRPLMATRTARRAICYAIARKAILRQDLLGGQQPEGCELLSGPFTLGLSPEDPVGYANNEQVRQRPYNPSLAIALYAIAQRSLAKPKTDEDSSELLDWAPLKLVYPDDALIAPTAATIARYLAATGIKCQLEVMPPGAGRPEGDWDLWYADVVMKEPAIDINWLIGERGLARGASSCLEATLRQLAVLTRKTDAKPLLWEIHRLVNDELVLIPLWQLTDHLAHHNKLQGISKEPASLYQDVESWRME